MPWLENAFYFDWNGGRDPTPITAQCETIHITWGPPSGDGPKPTPPYTFTIYTSIFPYPIMIDAGSSTTYALTIPFPPGTKYIICMYDKNGNTGGCQDMYTVYPSPTPLPSSCTNFTAPSRAMSVSLPPGSSSETGWPLSCSEMSFFPREGTPPFNFTVASALRPPFNMTVDSRRNFTWTIGLDHATPFFISIIDSKGLTWKHGGPKHAGFAKDNDISCLGGAQSKKGVSTPILVGSTVGAFVLGTILACLVGLFFLRRSKRSPREPASSSTTNPVVQPPPTMYHSTPFTFPTNQQNSDQAVAGGSRPTPNGRQSSTDFSEGKRSVYAPSSPDTRGYPNGFNTLPYNDNLSSEGMSPTASEHQDNPSFTGGRAAQPIFVVHHDGGTPQDFEAPATEQPYPPYAGNGVRPLSFSGGSRFAEGDGRPPGAAAPYRDRFSGVGRVVSSDGQLDQKVGWR